MSALYWKSGGYAKKVYRKPIRQRTISGFPYDIISVEPSPSHLEVEHHLRRPGPLLSNFHIPSTAGL